MRILLVGNGGREHALAWRLARSPSVAAVVCPNGNPGIATVAETPAAALNDNAAWVEFARAGRHDLVVIGPEAPLAAGLGDAMRAAGFPVFGPDAAGARIESSKAWSKQVMEEAGIPTARSRSFSGVAAARDFARTLGLPVVIKADGLAAGKGVTVATTWAEADQAINENLEGRRFGDSSACILVEEFMEGEEASIFGLADGREVMTLVAAQDHKRVFDGDQGPNTGGMGAYAPAPIVTPEVEATVRRTVFAPLMDYFRRIGIDYRGVIYAGLMLTPTGPRVVEFNCRFGDPETQVVLPLLEGDFGQLLLACAEGRLAGVRDRITTRPGSAATVVMASGGYPGDIRTGLEIRGLDAAAGAANCVVFHAGTRRDGDRVVTAGGRVLAVTAWDSSLANAVGRAYDCVRKISFEGCHFRRDIGWRALRPER
jgi:phosphoribosylamine--glycine ligase